MTQVRVITDTYRKMNAHIHATDKKWGSGGLLYFDAVAAIVRDARAQSVLDYGCGKGGLVTALKNKGFDARGYDPAVPEFSATPESADFLVCLDVLEHIEPELLSNVLSHMVTLAPEAFLVISTRRAKQQLPDGRNAHLIVENCDWWTARIQKFYARVSPVPGLRPSECVLRCTV